MNSQFTALDSNNKRIILSSNTWLSGRDTLTVFSLSSLDVICSERRLEPEFERESIGGLRLVAPRPASRLFSSEGLRAQMKAWNEDTVNTPNLFNVFFVARDTWVKRLWKQFNRIAFCKKKKLVNHILTKKIREIVLEYITSNQISCCS
jgi:hypothetical protein